MKNTAQPMQGFSPVNEPFRNLFSNARVPTAAALLETGASQTSSQVVAFGASLTSLASQTPFTPLLSNRSDPSSHSTISFTPPTPTRLPIHRVASGPMDLLRYLVVPPPTDSSLPSGPATPVKGGVEGGSEDREPSYSPPLSTRVVTPAAFGIDEEGEDAPDAENQRGLSRPTTPRPAPLKAGAEVDNAFSSPRGFIAFGPLIPPCSNAAREEKGAFSPRPSNPPNPATPSSSKADKRAKNTFSSPHPSIPFGPAPTQKFKTGKNCKATTSSPHQPQASDPPMPTMTQAEKSTCFFWYHTGTCNLWDSLHKCPYAHVPGVLVKAPPGYSHHIECRLPLCPLRKVSAPSDYDSDHEDSKDAERSSLPTSTDTKLGIRADALMPVSVKQEPGGATLKDGNRPSNTEANNPTIVQSIKSNTMAMSGSVGKGRMTGKTVTVIGGTHKGLQGIVRATNSNDIRVYLRTKKRRRVSIKEKFLAVKEQIIDCNSNGGGDLQTQSTKTGSLTEVEESEMVIDGDLTSTLTKQSTNEAVLTDANTHLISPTLTRERFICFFWYHKGCWRGDECHYEHTLASGLDLYPAMRIKRWNVERWHDPECNLPLCPYKQTVVSESYEMEISPLRSYDSRAHSRESLTQLGCETALTSKDPLTLQSKDEAAPTNVPSLPKPSTPPAQALICFFWYHGSCKYGENCKYLHRLEPGARVKRIYTLKPSHYGCDLPLCPYNDLATSTSHEIGSKRPSNTETRSLPDAEDIHTVSNDGNASTPAIPLVNDSSTLPMPSSLRATCFHWYHGETCTLGTNCPHEHTLTPGLAVYEGSKEAQRDHDSESELALCRFKKHAPPASYEIPSSELLETKRRGSPLPNQTPKRLKTEISSSAETASRTIFSTPPASLSEKSICFYWYHTNTCTRGAKCPHEHALAPGLAFMKAPGVRKWHVLKCALALCPYNKHAVPDFSVTENAMSTETKKAALTEEQQVVETAANRRRRAAAALRNRERKQFEADRAGRIVGLPLPAPEQLQRLHRVPSEGSKSVAMERKMWMPSQQLISRQRRDEKGKFREHGDVLDMAAEEDEEESEGEAWLLDDGFPDTTEEEYDREKQVKKIGLEVKGAKKRKLENGAAEDADGERRLCWDTDYFRQMLEGNEGDCDGGII